MSNKYNIGDTLYRLSLDGSGKYASICRIEVRSINKNHNETWQYGENPKSLYEEVDYFIDKNEALLKIKNHMEGK